jgi:hypothetical protein
MDFARNLKKEKRMKKRILLSTLVAGLLTSSLYAGTLSLEAIDGDGAGYSTTDDASAVTFDPRLAANARYDINQAADSKKIISYVPSVEISDSYEITFTATNGAFKGSTDWKLVSTGHLTDGSAASANADDDIIATVTDYEEDANGNYTRMVLTVSDGLQIDADEVVTLVLGADDSADDDSNGAYSIVIDQGATADVTVAVPKVQSDTGVEKDAPKAAAYTVVSKGNTLTAVFDDDDNVIDVESDRLKIIVNGNGADKFATGTLTLDAGDADKHYDLTSNPTDSKYTITMNGDMTGITKITLDSGAEFTIDGDTATLSSDIDTDDLTAGVTLTVEVDEKTTLKTREFDIDVVIDDVNGDDNNPNIDTDKQDLDDLTNAMVWDINGYQAKVRNFANNPGVKTSVVTLFNENALDAELTADIVMTDGSIVPTITLPNVPAGQRSVVTGAMLDDATDGALGKNDYTVEFTMTIPSRDGDAVALQETTKGSRVLPVVDNSSANNAN